ncbi:MAG: NAD-glutamate dehydrogenase [Pseudomonadales bacterium]
MIWAGDRVKLLTHIREQVASRLSGPAQVSVGEFVDQYLESFPTEELEGRRLEDIFGLVMHLWQFIRHFDGNSPIISVANPSLEGDGWQSNRTVIMVLAANMPFLMNSVRLELNRRNLVIHSIHSTVLSVCRDERHDLLGMADEHATVCSQEALLYLEITRTRDKNELAAIRAAIFGVLRDVTLVVEDWLAMQQRLQDALGFTRNSSGGPCTEDREEAATFLSWLLENNFTFMGFERLTVEYSGNSPKISSIDEDKHGLWRSFQSTGIKELKRALKEPALTEHCSGILVFSRSGNRSRVNRDVYPEIISIREFDDKGRIVSEYRFMGLYSSYVYTTSVRNIPVIRRKVSGIVTKSDLSPGSHDARHLMRVLETYPREELFHTSEQDLFSICTGINRIQERRQVRVFWSLDAYDKFLSCLVYLPRDLYNTELRLKIQDFLSGVLQSSESQFNTWFSDSALTRTYYLFHLGDRESLGIDLGSIAEQIQQLVTPWKEQFRSALLDEFGEERGTESASRYLEAFPRGYQDDFSATTAVRDVSYMQRLHQSSPIALRFYRLPEDKRDVLRLDLYHLSEPLVLSEVIPLLEQLGLKVMTERPYQIRDKRQQCVWIHNFALSHLAIEPLSLETVQETFEETFLRIWHGDMESDSFNRLLLSAKLNWREISLLRGYARYMKQLAFGFSEVFIAETLGSHTSITVNLLRLFDLRLNPESMSQTDTQEVEGQLSQDIISQLDLVSSLNEDQVIRHYLELINCTLRTNYYQLNSESRAHNYISLKFDVGSIKEAPLPRPKYEIFVCSPRVEGVHLRGGKVARGGLRWSDRPEDYRTEVLGLMKAQQVKNSIIVPVGAKGGFVAKRLPDTDNGDLIRAEVVSCYKDFIRGLLDVTDNLLDGEIVHPQQVRIRDDADPYLVVAADKGTATFSDIANQLAAEYGFWLDDAFASGGSVGYDHKKIGITARGAWVSVQGHFREMGIDIQKQPFTVVGIGGMGGDVFGNGMLLSEQIRLVAVFDHAHIFIDPNPDAAASFTERSRLFALPQAGWDHYDSSLLSAGGGVFSRAAKSIIISPELKACLNIEADQLTPNQLISAILKSPVDLLWNGGIGTYVKSSKESNEDVGDRANDHVRINGNELGAKVVGEGGNLGMTQLGRVEFALCEGRVHTDFIDNAGGVNCSDFEVNIKILLNTIVANGDLTRKQRLQLLEKMTDEVAAKVLQGSYRQAAALSLAHKQSLVRAGEYQRYIHALESQGLLVRSLEFIPDEEALAERQVDGKGLTRPELAVIMAYTKSDIKNNLIDTQLVKDDYTFRDLQTSFPEVLCQRFAKEMSVHSLRRQITATQLANDLVDHVGITFIYRLQESTGASVERIVKAYIAVRDIYGIHQLTGQIQSLDYQVESEVQADLHVALIRLAHGTVRWMLRNTAAGDDIADLVYRFSKPVEEVAGNISDLFHRDLEEFWRARYNRFVSRGAPEDLSSLLASIPQLFAALEISVIASELDVETLDAAQVFFRVGEVLHLTALSSKVFAVRVHNSWQAIAREGLLDEIVSCQCAIAAAVIRCRHDGESEAGLCLEAWIEERPEQVSRWQHIFTGLGSDGEDPFAMFMVAVRELAALAKNGI